MHKVPTTSEATIEQTFWRGQIAVLEDIIGLKEELKDWKGK